MSAAAILPPAVGETASAGLIVALTVAGLVVGWKYAPRDRT